ncbi:MAG: hypothetical protein R3A79_22150 [Nannocystaceae bacterium]
MSSMMELRRRYEATPRTIDDDLHGLARGDRGCLGDALAGIGAVTTALFGVIASTGAGGWGFMGIGAVLFIAGFALSAMHQSRSSQVRRQALEEGALVAGRVLRADPSLREPGRGCAPAIVVLSLDPARRFDPRHLDAAKRRLANATGEVAELLAAEHIEGIKPIPESAVGAPSIGVAEVIVDRERLEGNALQDDDQVLALIVDPRVGFVEHIG